MPVREAAEPWHTALGWRRSTGRQAEALGCDRHPTHKPWDCPGAHQHPVTPPSPWGNCLPSWSQALPAPERSTQTVPGEEPWCPGSSAPSLGQLPAPSLSTMAMACSWSSFPHAGHAPSRPLQLPAGRRGCSDPSKAHGKCHWASTGKATASRLAVL